MPPVDGDLTAILSRATTGADFHNFHETGTFVGIWVLVAILAPNVLMKLRPLLMPLAWAFFMMMILLPLTDLVEKGLLWLLGKSWQLCGQPRLPSCKRCLCSLYPESKRRGVTWATDNGHAEVSGEDADELDPASSSGSELPEAERTATNQSRTEENSEKSEDPACGGCGVPRMIAVLLVMCLFVGFFVAFAFAIYESALHMKENWNHYQEGGNRLKADIDKLMHGIPDEVMDKAVEKVQNNLSEFLTLVVSGSIETIGSILAEVVMMLLYMMFWLCNPMYIGTKVTRLFKRYIMLKGLASFMYASCVWVLLETLDIDLATVMGIITFFFNFIPEVGPFLAMMLPVPIILFDDRLENPYRVLGWALFGQLTLKFIFGNIVEVLLVEAQEEMHMHPVIICFGMMFFGWIWGATGMVLSVPMMAVVKASLHTIPANYRDPILIALEGDQRAPVKWRERREASRDFLDKTPDSSSAAQE